MDKSSRCSSRFEYRHASHHSALPEPVDSNFPRVSASATRRASLDPGVYTDVDVFSNCSWTCMSCSTFLSSFLSHFHTRTLINFPSKLSGRVLQVQFIYMVGFSCVAASDPMVSLDIGTHSSLLVC